MRGIKVGGGPCPGVLLTGPLHLMSGNFPGVLAVSGLQGMS